MTIKEEVELITQYEWNEFTKCYPRLTSRKWIAKILVIFNRSDIQRLLWENGFYRGWVIGRKCTEDIKHK